MDYFDDYDDSAPTCDRCEAELVTRSETQIVKENAVAMFTDVEFTDVDTGEKEILYAPATVARDGWNIETIRMIVSCPNCGELSELSDSFTDNLHLATGKRLEAPCDKHQVIKVEVEWIEREAA